MNVTTFMCRGVFNDTASSKLAFNPVQAVSIWLLTTFVQAHVQVLSSLQLPVLQIKLSKTLALEIFQGGPLLALIDRLLRRNSFGFAIQRMASHMAKCNT
jgi:hypothetical protein